MRISGLLFALVACSPSHVTPPPLPPAAPADTAPPAPVDPPTPLDARITTGKLANGLTYYILPHKKPEQRAALWLAVNAGSVLEDDDQRGLAHFVEHMAFNGTKRFPKMEIVNYIEKTGMTFGADLNAYTNIDETVYQLTVPTDSKAVMLQGLDILRDWAGDVTFDPVEVDKERGVVLEEWRLRRGAGARIRDKQWPIILQGSRYADRITIGLPEIIKTAKRDTLYRFYKDWYRPDLMAVIAVGDFDPAAMKKEIESRFADLVNPAKERQRPAVPVPHDQPMAVTIVQDPELRSTDVEVYDKLDHRPNATKADFRRVVVESLYHAMLNARFGELREDPASPFIGAGSSTRPLVRTVDIFARTATAKENHTEDTLALLYHEIERVERHGFLASELDRARSNLITRAETAARERDKTHMRAFVSELTRVFLRHEQMPGPETELAWIKEFVPTITLDELDHLAKSWSSDKGRVIAISAPSSAKVPSEADVRAIVAKAKQMTVEPWTDDGANKPLVATPPPPGKVVKTEHDAAADATVWTLANGVKVVVKPTTFQNDAITISGTLPGGSSLISDKDFPQGEFADDVVSASGAGDFDPTALRKALAGKIAGVNVGIGELEEFANVATRPADLETALQLLYLDLTAPRRDERAFARWKAQAIEATRHRRDSPENLFNDTMAAWLTNDNLRRRPVTPEMIQAVDLDKALAIWKTRFADLGNFTFVIVGNVDLATLQPLVETYLGGLPSKGNKDHWRDVGIKPLHGKANKEVDAGSEPKARVEMLFGADDKWSLDGERDARILAMALRIRLREVLREDMGGVYGVQVFGAISREPTQRRTFFVSFGCDPANVDKLRDAVFAEVAKIQKDGVSDDYIAKISEQLKRSHETELKENRFWTGTLDRAYHFHDDVAKLLDVDAVVKRVTSANIKASAKHFFDGQNVAIGVLKPKTP
jgi:zinc protease